MSTDKLDKDKLTKLFKYHFSKLPDSIEALKAHASARKLYRLSCDGQSYIGVSNSDRAENSTFIAFSKHFLSHALPVPEIYCQDLEAGLYIEEDLGNETLFDLLDAQRTKADPFPEKIERLYKDAIKILPKFQIEAGESLDYSLCYQRTCYDRQAILNDMHYFKDSFLKPVQVSFDKQNLEKDFNSFADYLSEIDSEYFLYRDFQARNIMIKDDKPYFIDYQSGRKGPLQYDVASLLYQSRANIPQAAKTRIIDSYLEQLKNFLSFDKNDFLNALLGFVYIRIIQTFGTYGNVGLKQGKRYFIESIPPAISNLLLLLDSDGLPIDLPTLQNVFYELKNYNKDKQVCSKS